MLDLPRDKPKLPSHFGERARAVVLADAVQVGA
jgi:hypothetical protein